MPPVRGRRYPPRPPDRPFGRGPQTYLAGSMGPVSILPTPVPRRDSGTVVGYFQVGAPGVEYRQTVRPATPPPSPVTRLRDPTPPDGTRLSGARVHPDTNPPPVASVAPHGHPHSGPLPKYTPVSSSPRVGCYTHSPLRLSLPRVPGVTTRPDTHSHGPPLIGTSDNRRPGPASPHPSHRREPLRGRRGRSNIGKTSGGRIDPTDRTVRPEESVSMVLPDRPGPCPVVCLSHTPEDLVPRPRSPTQ